MASEVRFTVAGLPPAKSEAKSMLAQRHPHEPRVRALLAAARDTVPSDTGVPALGSSTVGLEVTATSPAAPDSDATNYLGGIADVLESKQHRGALPHLGDLAAVALYDNDRQIQEVHYRHQLGSPTSYAVRVWLL